MGMVSQKRWFMGQKRDNYHSSEPLAKIVFL